MAPPPAIGYPWADSGCELCGSHLDWSLIDHFVRSPAATSSLSKMPRQITEYRVFIASPGGLQEERQRFRDALIEYNASDALPRGVVFTPVGWEDTLGGIGRPQSLINEELKECDFFVLVLWDRWGTPPDNDEGPYTSGTEEEFAVAREALADENAPMRQLVAFFKAVDPKQLSDPGAQLSKVLEFRKQLEANKELLYQTFDSSDRFGAVLRRHLGAWVLAHEKHSTLRPELPSEFSHQVVASREVEALGNVERAALEQAWKLANDGRRTEAETLFSRAIVRANDPGAFVEFGRFLFRDGRIDQAIVMLERAHELAVSSGDQRSAASALRWIGNIFLTRGAFDRAEEHYRTALGIDENLGRLESLADDYTSLGNLLFMRRDLAGAKAMHLKALGIEEKLGKTKGLSAAYGNVGLLHYSSGDVSGAEAMYLKALEIDEQLGWLEGMAISYGNLGLVLDARNDLTGAEAMYRKALKIDEKLGRLEGMATHYANIGNVFSARGDLVGAELMFLESLAIQEKLGRLPEIAKIHWSLGNNARRRENWNSARKYYQQALKLFEQLGIPDHAADLRELLTSLE